MEKTSLKKITLSYLITSVLIFIISAATSMLGLFGKGVGAFGMSVELMMLIQLTVVLLANLLLHGLFYFGGFHSSPIKKGISIGAVIGVSYFLITVFLVGSYNIETESMAVLLRAAGGRVVEYCTGGVMTALISVSEIHRWGLLKAF